MHTSFSSTSTAPSYCVSCLYLTERYRICTPYTLTVVAVVQPVTLHHGVRWTTTLSSKVKWPHVIKLNAIRGANSANSHSKFQGNETLGIYRVAWGGLFVANRCQNRSTRFKSLKPFSPREIELSGSDGSDICWPPRKVRVLTSVGHEK